MQQSVNVDIWFDKLAFQPAQAVLGSPQVEPVEEVLVDFPEVIPIADSDYVYAAIAEETGLAGGAVVIGYHYFRGRWRSHFAGGA